MALVVRTTGVEEFLDAAGEPNIKALIMGEPSAGKTRSASFWPAPIFADCEDGRMSLADRRVPFVRVTSSRDMDALLSMLEFECQTKRPPQRRYQTLVVDTLDAYQRTVIQEILAGREAMAGWEDWGALNNKMTSFVARLNKLPMNLVVNLHIKATKDGTDGPLVKEPRLAGDLRDAITAEFDLVGWMHTQWEAEGGERVLKRVLKWFPEPGFPTLKDRSGQLPRMTRVEFTEDDYQGLFERIFGGEAFDALRPGEHVQDVDAAEPAQPVEPHAGGPVAPKRKKVPAQTAAAEPQVTQQVTEQVPQTAPGAAPEAEQERPKARRNVPAARRPEPTPEPVPEPPQEAVQQELGEGDMDQALAVVAEQLGGQVVTDPPPAEAEQVPAAQQTQPVPSGQADTEPDENRLICGTGLTGSSAKPVPGCGKDLEGEDRDMVNISLIKTKTYLCPDCLKKWKTSAGK